MGISLQPLVKAARDNRFLARWRALHPLHRQMAGTLLAVMAVSGLLLAVQPGIHNRWYQIKPATSRLIGPANQALSPKLSYDQTKQLYQYNQKAIGKTSSGGQEIGGGADNYATSLAAGGSHTITIYDTTDTSGQLHLSLTPLFGTRAARNESARIVYPLAGKSGQIIYSLKSNGLKEDLVLTRPPGDKASFSYRLSLPSSLQAKLLSDGTIGVYSADPALFGNISYGSSADQAKVAKARQYSPKTHLVFAIPAPVIKQSGKQSSHPQAKFSLSGDTLTLSANGLSHASYPLSIDPSVVVNSAQSFNLGNFEGNIQLNASNQLQRGALLGGTVPSWTQTNTGASGYNGSNGALGAAAVVYNGFIYVSGGAYSNNTGSVGTVSYASINSTTGSIGTWTQGSSFINPRQQHGMAEYNGYLYIAGGNANVSNGGCSDATTTSACNDVQFAKINTANGSVGAWHYTHNSTDDGTTFVAGFTTQRWSPGLVAANGRLYVIGGAYKSGLNTGYLNDTQYASINANGTIGSWATSGVTLPAGESVTAATYNGYIYVSQNCDATLAGCSSATQTVSYASIKSTGDISSWSASPTYTATYGETMVIYGGYIYLLGSYDGSSTFSTYVQYAPIYANGSVGSWKMATSFTTGRDLAAATVNNGYLYIVGGQITTTTNTNDTQYAKIDSAGVAGDYSNNANNYSGTSRAGYTSVAYNGCLYVISGFDSAYENNLIYASINSDGSTGTWTVQASPTFAVGRQYLAATAYNGYLYIVGGFGAGNTEVSEVDYAQFNASGCGTGSFNTGSSLNTTREKLGLVASNGFLYAIGGVNSSNTTLLSSVEYTTIASNGVPGTWAFTSSINATNREMGATAWGGYLYITGGDIGPGTNTPYVQYVPICTGQNTVGTCTTSSTPGTLGAWHFTHNGTDDNTTFVAGFNGNNRKGMGLIASKGFLYLTGGLDAGGGTSPDATNQYAHINSDGTVGSWSSSPSLGTAVFRQGAVMYNDIFYNIGGCTAWAVFDGCNSVTTVVQYASINNGGPGTTTSWAASAQTFTTGRYGHTSLAYNGFLYVLGGCNNSSCSSPFLGDVQYAPINSDGSLGTWSTTNSITARAYHASSVYNGYLYVTGGNTNTNLTNNTQYALICTGTNSGIGGCGSTAGAVGTWQSTSHSFSLPRYSHTSVAYNGYLYVIGGCSNGSCSTYQNDVQYALICNGFNSGTDGCGSTVGDLGNWHTNSTSFIDARFAHASVAVNGYLYVMAGQKTGGTLLGDVQYAPINSDGSVGTWNYTNSFQTSRQNPVAWSSNGYMYMAAGNSSAATFATDVQYAPVNSNGTLGAWLTTQPLNTGRIQPGIAVYKGYIYITGGCTGGALTVCTAQSNNVEYAGQQAIPRVGRYSYLSDFSGDALPTKILYNGTLGGSSLIGLNYTSATSSSAVFGSTTPILGLKPGVLSSLTAKEQRYTWLSFTLDDSQNAAFPDNLGTPSTISDLRVWFHPAPTNRLRGGALLNTSNSTLLNTLDTTPN